MQKIYEKTFQQFKNFVEELLGLNGPAFCGYFGEAEAEFNSENLESILTEEEIELFNNEQFYEIETVVIFINALNNEGYYIWEDEFEFAIDEWGVFITSEELKRYYGQE